MIHQARRVVSFVMVLSILSTAVVLAGPRRDVPAGVRVERSARTGLASFVTASDGGAIPMQSVPAVRTIQPMDFLNEHGALFGVSNPNAQLVLDAAHTRTDELGFKHTTYRQVHKGIEVFAGVLKVHQDGFGAVVAANGDFFPIPDTLDTTPPLYVAQAVRTARSRIDVPQAQPETEVSRLVIVDPGWYGDVPAGAHLAYYIVLTDLTAGVRDAFFIDAHTGKPLDRWSLLHTSKSRSVFDDSAGFTVRTEGGAATGDFDADAAYDYSGDMYDFLFRTFGRDSVNGFGATLASTVHLQSSSCPNAFGGGTSASFCDGIVTDDIVAHEYGHGLTDATANLIYQNQSGQLNESFSDVWGEVIDLLNGDVAFPGPPGGTPWPMDPTHVGGGTDTPNDLRTGCVFGTLMTVNAPGSISGDYGAQPASFGASLNAVGVTGDLVVADPVRGCDVDLPFANGAAMNGKIVLIDRGDCFFTEKVLNAQDQGAIAVIVANNLPAGAAPMGGSDPAVVIPSVGITQSDGNLLKAEALMGTVNLTLHSAAAIEVRWLVGEDSSGFGGAIRDMWRPSCMGDPDTANDPLQICRPGDSGGVHGGSGVPNHAFAILTDGDTFNGFTINGIGLFKASAVWYRALTVYLTTASDFQEAFAGFNAAASDLVGTMIIDPRDGSNFALFTNADAVDVNNALLAVEMDTRGRCGDSQVLDTTPPQQCGNKSIIFADDFESGLNGWTVSVSGPSGPPTPYNWVQVSGGLPFGQPGTVWFGEDRNVGDCAGQDESAVHSLFSPMIPLPSSLMEPTLAFTHFVDIETFFDGGNVKISVNGGAWQLIPNEAFTFNAYNGSLETTNNTNPLAGEEAFTGSALSGGGWGTSLVDLSGFVSGGETIQLRFDMSKDGCGGASGWFLDDFEVYQCTDVVPTSPDAPSLGDDTCHDGGTDLGVSCGTDLDCSGAGFAATSNLPIPDNDPVGVTNTITVPDSFNVLDVNVGTLIPHSWVGDLIVTVTHGATVVTIVDRMGVPASSSGCDSDDLSLVLDDEGTGGAVEDICGPLTTPQSPPNYVPNEPLSAFDGMNAAGDWTITVTDNAAGELGFLIFWSLEFTGPGGQCGLKSRYLTVTPSNPVVAGSTPTSIRVEVVSNPLDPTTVGNIWWAGPEQPLDNAPNAARTGAELECTTTPHAQVWTTGLLDLFGAAIVPGAQYEVRQCIDGGTLCSDSLLVSTGQWGDAAAPFTGASQPNFSDVNAIVAKFQVSSSAPDIPRVDLAGPGGTATPNTPNAGANFLDINLDVGAFQGAAYPFTSASCTN